MLSRPPALDPLLEQPGGFPCPNAKVEAWAKRVRVCRPAILLSLDALEEPICEALLHFGGQMGDKNRWLVVDNHGQLWT